MTSCLRISDFQRYIDEADAAVETHLAGCVKCRAAFARVAATSQRADTWLSALASPVEDMPIDVMTALAGVTRSRPVDHVGSLLSAREIWGQYAWNSRSRYAALTIHAAAFALLMVGTTNKTVQQSIRERFDLIDPTVKPYVPEKASGGGGGGARQPLPVSAGQAPKPAMKQFVPPQIVDRAPKLAMSPAIVLPPDTVLPQNNLPNWGDPLAKLSTLSNGPGGGGGMGPGNGGGLGPGHGVGYGPGDGSGIGDGVYRAGGGVSAPVLVFKTDPEYSEEARKSKYSGSVTLAIVVDTEGRARDIHVTRSLGMGLDEKAMEAVRQWKFKPGMKGGQAVNVRATIEVNFRLL